MKKRNKGGMQMKNDIIEEIARLLEEKADLEKVKVTYYFVLELTGKK